MSACLRASDRAQTRFVTRYRLERDRVVKDLIWIKGAGP
jgi:hypothetical protein